MKATVKKIEELIQRNIHLPKSHPSRKSGETKVNCNNKILSFNFLFNLFLSPIKICAQINIDSIQIAGIHIQPSYILIVYNVNPIPFVNVQDKDPIAPAGKKSKNNCFEVIIDGKFSQDSFILKAIS